MSKLLKKLIVSLVAVIYLFSATAVSTQAQETGPWYNQNFVQWSNKVFDETNQNEIFGERYTYAQVNWIINSLTAVLIGSDISNCVSKGGAGDLKAVGECMKAFAPANPTASPAPSNPPTNPSANPSQLYAPPPASTGMSSGAVGGLAFLTNSILNTKPASGMAYIRETAARLHIVPEAYAQAGGVGFNTLSPVQSLWRVVRDISYALMVVVFIAMAFMIMFRVKINPQTVISVQSALPKVVIALILITFSYAIAGFLVDLMYVIVAAFAGMIKIGASTISNGDVPYLFTQLSSGNGLWSIVIGIIIFTVIFLGGGLLLTIGGTIATFTVVGSPLGIPFLIVGVLLLIVAVVVLIIIIRLFLLLVKTAAVTILLIIAGPFMILMGTLTPTGGAGAWIRSLLANLAVYPTVIILIFLAHYFFWGWFVGGFLTTAIAAFTPFNTFNINVWNMRDTATTISLGAPDTAPIINLPGMPVRTNILGFMLSFVILFLIPKAADIIQSIISGKAFSYGAAIGEALGPVRMALGLAQGAAIGEAGYRAAEFAERQKGVRGPDWLWDAIVSYAAQRKYAQRGPGSSTRGVSRP